MQTLNPGPDGFTPAGLEPVAPAEQPITPEGSNPYYPDAGAGETGPIAIQPAEPQENPVANFNAVAAEEPITPPPADGGKPYLTLDESAEPVHIDSPYTSDEAKHDMMKTATYIGLGAGAILIPLILLCITCKRATSDPFQPPEKKAKSYQQFDREDA